jgi:hypothetical protein
MENCDGGAQEDCYWCIYENEEGDVNVVVEYYFDKHVEYEATVLLYDNVEYAKQFVFGQEDEMMKFITTDKLLLKEQWSLEQIKRDFV